MASAFVKLYETNSSRLEALPFCEGQMIFVNDIQTVYLDFNGIRTSYTGIAPLNSEQDRLALTPTLPAFYYVLSSHILYRWDGDKWRQITPPNLSPVFVGEGGPETFPAVGQSDVAYLGNDGVYKWSGTAGDYVMVANLTVWDLI